MLIEIRRRRGIAAAVEEMLYSARGVVACKPRPGIRGALYTDANLIPFDGILFIPGLFARYGEKLSREHTLSVEGGPMGSGPRRPTNRINEAGRPIAKRHGDS